MYTSLWIRGFKCFDELTLGNLSRVNLFAGVNNSGKTALLEAIFLHCGAYSPEITFKLNAFRGIEKVNTELTPWAETPWDWFFANMDTAREIELSGQVRNRPRRSLWLRVLRNPEDLARVPSVTGQRQVNDDLSIPATAAAQVLELCYREDEREGCYYLIIDQNGARTEPLPPAPPFPAIFLPARGRFSPAVDAQRFGTLRTENKHDVILDALRVIEPRLRDLTVVAGRLGPLIYGDIGLPRLIPLPFLGEGMGRLASLLLAVGNAPGGVVLVDEIENGLHHSILQRVWEVLGNVAARFDTQIFATTHSFECIEAAHRAFARTDSYEFRLHRLEQVDSRVRCVTYDRETLEGAIDSGLEVR